MALSFSGLVPACPALASADDFNDGHEARDIAMCEAIKKVGIGAHALAGSAHNGG